MKFNIEAALNGAPVLTKKGEEVIALYHIKEIPEDKANLIVLIKDSTPGGTNHIQRQYYPTGVYPGNKELSLIMKPTPKFAWLNFYLTIDGKEEYSKILYSTELVARTNSRKGVLPLFKEYLGPRKVEIKEVQEDMEVSYDDEI